MAQIETSAGQSLNINFEEHLPRARQHRCGIPELAKAVGFGSGITEIVDATAGLGRESFLLAQLGLFVTALERDPLIHRHLTGAWERAYSQLLLQPVLRRLNFKQADAIVYLKDKNTEVVYLDPMIVEPESSARIKKSMAFLRSHLGTDNDAHELFEVAMASARKRVVVKRPLNVEALDPKVTHSWQAGKHRFDMYLRA